MTNGDRVRPLCLLDCLGHALLQSFRLVSCALSSSYYYRVGDFQVNIHRRETRDLLDMQRGSTTCARAFDFAERERKANRRHATELELRYSAVKPNHKYANTSCTEAENRQTLDPGDTFRGESIDLETLLAAD